MVGTLAQAIDELGEPRLKVTRPVPSFKGTLTLGEPGLDTTLSIDVERYPRVMVRKPQSASTVIQPINSVNEKAPITIAGEHSGNVDPDSKGDKEAEKKPRGRQYEVDDKDAEGGKRLVTVDELAKGYEYGRTAVHISESDFDITQFQAKAGLEILGFIPQDNVG